MVYPTISEYIESIKYAEDNFATLTNLRPVLDEDGNPIMSSGNFAVVFKMQDVETKEFFAIKCFTREQEGRLEAYELISEELANIKIKKYASEKLSYLVDVKFLNKELFVDSSNSSDTEFPVLLMDWVEGEPLDKMIKRYIDTENSFLRNRIKKLALDFLDFAHWMINLPIAHGDIKPDNILVRDDGSLVLVDYDGMFVPSMLGQTAREIGSPGYRHPARTIDDFNEHIDDFSLCIIAFSIASISINKDTYNKEVEDALVFSDKDLIGLNDPFILTKIGLVLHDKLCSLLFAAILMLINNPESNIEYNALFDTKTYLTQSPPNYLPFKIGKNKFLLCETNSGQNAGNHIFSDIKIIGEDEQMSSILVADGGEIDYSSLNDFGGGVIRIQDFIRYELGQKEPKANRFAIVTSARDINNPQWFKYIKPITHAIFLAKDDEDSFGLLSPDSAILLPFEFSSISPLEIKGEIFLMCKNKKGESGLYKVINRVSVINILKVKYNDKQWHYKNGASEPENFIIFNEGRWLGYDLERGLIINMPSHLKRVKAYSEKILCLELWGEDEGIRLYDVDKEDFINSDSYKSVGFYKNELHPFKDGYSICETSEHKNVIVFVDGTSFIIPYESHRMHRGVNSKYVFYNYEIIHEPIFNSKQDILEFTVFDYRTRRIHTFRYLWDSWGMKAISLYDDEYFDISSHSMKYNLTTRITTLDLQGNQIVIPKKVSCDKDIHNQVRETFDSRTILEHIIEAKFINKTHIPEIERYEGVECQIKEGYAKIVAICDVDPEFGVYTELIGYADANRCYWQIEYLSEGADANYYSNNGTEENFKGESCLTKCTAKDDENSWEDEYGAKYSEDRKRLLSFGHFIEGIYYIKPGTHIICDLAFNCFENDNHYLDGVYIPKSVRYIGENPFAGCVDFRIICDSPYFKEENGILYDAQYIRLIAITNPTSRNLPIDNRVKTIGPFACSYINARTVYLPNGLERIDDFAFARSGITEITIPLSVISIGQRAFMGCRDLHDIYIMSENLIVFDEAFDDCGNIHYIFVPKVSLSYYKQMLKQYSERIKCISDDIEIDYGFKQLK